MNELVLMNGDELVVSDEFAKRIKKLAEFQITLQEMKNEEEEVKEIFRDAMEKFNVKSIELAGVRITRIDPTTRTTVDSKRLKAEYPEVYNDCTKVSNVKGSIKIQYD